MPSDDIRPITFDPSPSLASVAATSDGWTTDCRGPRAAQVHSFTREGCTAEIARALRDEGVWSLRFGPGCEGVAAQLRPDADTVASDALPQGEPRAPRAALQ